MSDDMTAVAEVIANGQHVNGRQVAFGDARDIAHRLLASPALQALLAAAEQRGRVAALREAADDWPIGACAHRCFRSDEHIAPKDCLYGPTWLSERADREEAQ